MKEFQSKHPKNEWPRPIDMVLFFFCVFMCGMSCFFFSQSLSLYGNIKEAKSRGKCYGRAWNFLNTKKLEAAASAAATEDISSSDSEAEEEKQNQKQPGKLEKRRKRVRFQDKKKAEERRRNRQYSSVVGMRTCCC